MSDNPRNVDLYTYIALISTIFIKMEFIYWRHPTVPGIKVEEVTGGECYKGNLWLEMARQVYCENGREEYREIGHYKNGSPFLYNYGGRISLTHCDGMLAVATLPATPEVDLTLFSERAALGIDAERADRAQVLRIRQKFLSEAELAMVPADDIEANVLLWTVKEAAYKAMLTDGLDFASQIHIVRIPTLASPTPVFDSKEFGLPAGVTSLPDNFIGKVVVHRGELGQTELLIYSYRSDEHIVTLAYSPRCAKFGKSGLV